jgi:hypothetical protein
VVGLEGTFSSSSSSSSDSIARDDFFLPMDLVGGGDGDRLDLAGAVVLGLESDVRVEALRLRSWSSQASQQGK